MFGVVIVEDDPMVTAINKEYLARLGDFHLMATFSNGKDCLEYLKQHTVALVLLDVFMPGMNGLETLQVIHKEHCGVDVIMITAARRTDDIKCALRLGVVDYLMKPFTFERFQAALAAFQDRRRLLDSNRELEQSLLDRSILTRDKLYLPKGIDTDTLSIIQEFLTSAEKDCSMKDMETNMGLSRVTLKKYMIYLESTGKACSRLEYPPVGRPVRLYRWLV